MDNKKIGELIAKLRKEKGFTQQELGDKVGVGSRAVSKWECGLTIPDISIINELSSILEINPKELLSGKLSESKKTNNKSKISTKIKVLIIAITILIISLLSLLIYYNNKTYVYGISAIDHENYKIDGYVTYKNGTLGIFINKIAFNYEKLNLKIKEYQYYIKLEDEIILGYIQTDEDMTAGKRNIYSLKELSNNLKISYTGKTKYTKNAILEKDISLFLTLIDIDNNKVSNNIKIVLYKKKK